LRDKRKNLFTSESVAMGHPDKVADQVSDAVLDAYLTGDTSSRVACETMVTTGMALIAGEVTSKATPCIPDVVRDTIRAIGYDDAGKGFDADDCAVLVTLDRQSPDISQGVTEGAGLHKEQGAGDQGMMFGFACTDTPELMPAPIMLAHRLMIRLAEVRQKGQLPYLAPDGKGQVTVEYDGNKPVRVHTVVVSQQHADTVSLSRLHTDIVENVIEAVIPQELMDADTVIHVNPTGRFVVGGPHGDCGLTGRKIIVDTYGGRGSHGGGAFSGKDPSKVDRSANYAARYIAKNIVAAGLADICNVQLSYAIGVADPISILVDTEGTAKVDEVKIEKLVPEIFPVKPKAIIDALELLRPIYTETARHGHFGRSHEFFTWEKTDKIADLKAAFNL